MTPLPPAPAPRVPVPRTPEADAVVPLDAAVFRWDPPPARTGAAGTGASETYAVQVASDRTFRALLLAVDGLATTELVLADALPAGPLWWRVRAGEGPWCRAVGFTAGTPADDEVARRWEVGRERAHDRTGRPPAPALPEAPPEPVWPHPTGPSVDPAAPPVNWSAVAGFGPPDRADGEAVGGEAPIVVSPLGGEVVDAQTTSLSWQGVAGATGYDVEVSPDPAFARDVLAVSAGAATELALHGVLPPNGARLHWRVRARTGRGATAWSRYGRFYPAAADTAERFQLALGVARAAQRRQRLHAGLAAARARDLVAAHERSEAVTSAGEAAAVVAVGGVCVAVALGLVAVGLLAG